MIDNEISAILRPPMSGVRRSYQATTILRLQYNKCSIPCTPLCVWSSSILKREGLSTDLLLMPLVHWLLNQANCWITAHAAKKPPCAACLCKPPSINILLRDKMHKYSSCQRRRRRREREKKNIFKHGSRVPQARACVFAAERNVIQLANCL